jgi:fructose-1,6-bisphosphatase/inositol monophosphatase family enzyme
MQAAIERHLPHFEGIIRTELQPYTKTLIEISEHSQLVLIIDEIDGTTNTKRCLTASLEYHPLSAVSIALSLTESLDDLVVGAVYTLDRGEVFSAFRICESDFLAFHNHRRIDPEEVIHIKGDSKKRVLVIGYSNSHRLKKGELEQVLYDQRMKVYEGCRSSGMDIVSLLRNQSDAYIDLRRYWSTKDGQNKEREAMLQVYDIAGIVPIAEGCGLKVTDAEGKSWEDYSLDDTIPLIVSRPGIHADILKTISPLVEKWKGSGK